MRKLFLFLLTILFMTSCQDDNTVTQTQEELYVINMAEKFDMTIYNRVEAVKPIFIRKLADLPNNWKMVTGNSLQEIYLTPTLDVLDPFFITAWSEHSQCFGVIDYIPQTHPITVISQSLDAMLISSLTQIPNQIQYWLFFENSDGNLEWQVQTFENGILIIDSTWSMVFTPSTVDLNSLVYCAGESGPE